MTVVATQNATKMVIHITLFIISDLEIFYFEIKGCSARNTPSKIKISILGWSSHSDFRVNLRHSSVVALEGVIEDKMGLICSDIESLHPASGESRTDSEISSLTDDFSHLDEDDCMTAETEEQAVFSPTTVLSGLKSIAEVTRQSVRGELGGCEVKKPPESCEGDQPNPNSAQTPKQLVATDIVAVAATEEIVEKPKKKRWLLSRFMIQKFGLRAKSC